LSYDICVSLRIVYKDLYVIIVSVGRPLTELENRIVVDPKIMGGKPVIKGTRIPVYFILELLSNGWSIDDILREYPHLSREDVLAAIRYAAKVLREEVIVKA